MSSLHVSESCSEVTNNMQDKLQERFLCATPLGEFFLQYWCETSLQQKIFVPCLLQKIQGKLQKYFLVVTSAGLIQNFHFANYLIFAYRSNLRLLPE